MIIIIEGIDRVGKTTLANKLSKELNIPVFKKDRIGGKKDITYDSMALNFGNATGLLDMWNWKGFKQDIIVDRFHWTESVYGSIERHPETSFYMDIIEKVMELNKEKYLMVYMRPTSIERSSEEHGKDLSEHLKRFDELATNTQLDLIVGDYNQIDEIIKMVKEKVKCQDQEN